MALTTEVQAIFKRGGEMKRGRSGSVSMLEKTSFLSATLPANTRYPLLLMAEYSIFPEH
jgi:hypothetical protein